MAILSKGSEITVFKFRETGLVELCEEVVDYVNNGQAAKDGCILSTARYHEDHNGLNITFTRS